MKLLLRGGTVIDPRNGVNAPRDVRIDGGVIAEVGERLPAAGAEVVDVTGRWVLPGLIDLHVHLREPGEERKETILTGCKAAVAGGFTAVVAMPNTRIVNDSPLVTRLILERAREAGLCRVYPAGAITKGLAGEELAEMGALVGAGCVAVTDDGRPIMNAGLMRRALEWAAPLGVPVMVHEEDLTLSGRGLMSESDRATRLGLLPIPPSAEVAMVARDLVLLEETRTPLHLAHLSCEGSVRLVREAKRRGLPVTAEAAPHHFTLTHEAVERGTTGRGRYDTHAKMNPPLRDARDVEAILEGLADGTIDAIATDHAPHGVLEKDLEFDKAMNGVVGLETAVGLTLAAVHAGRLDRVRAVDALSSAPARAFRLPGGHLGKGGQADVTIVDPELEWTVDSARFYSRSRNTPFHGRTLKGRAVQTYVAGRRVFDLQKGPGGGA